jgi:Putative zinc-finger
VKRIERKPQSVKVLAKMAETAAVEMPRINSAATVNYYFKSSSNRRQTKMNRAADNNNEAKRDTTTDLEGMYGDRFELLSAYLDGEVSPAERQQVQSWLDSDPQTQHLYQRLLKLRQGWQQIAAPTTVVQADVLAGKIFARIDRRKNNRKILFWAGGAIAALFTGFLFVSDPISRSPLPQLANQIELDNNSENLLAAVSVDEPAVRIPKAANVYYPKEVQLQLNSDN